MHKTLISVIFTILTIQQIKGQDDIYAFYPCNGVDKVIETFSASDPYGFNVTVLLSKYDLLPGNLNLHLWLEVDAQAKFKNYFHSTTHSSNGFFNQHSIYLENVTDLTARVIPFKGTIPNLISVKINKKQICENGVVKDIWKNFVQLSTTSTISPPITTRKQEVNSEECGTRPYDFTPFIIHGNKAKPGDWPWHTAIYLLQSKKSQLVYICGGTLVTKTRVVTAGHCVIEHGSIVSPDRIHAVLGKYKFIGEDYGTQNKRVLDIILHPEYSRTNLTNDIAILKLSSEVTITETVHSICMKYVEYPHKSQIIGHNGYVVGWGRNEYGIHSDELAEALMPIRSDYECLKENPSFFGIFLNDGNFCVGRGNGTSVCNGDSGGGLYLPIITPTGRKWYLRGIVSLGVAKENEKVCDPAHYTLFTDVAYHEKFIKQHL